MKNRSQKIRLSRLIVSLLLFGYSGTPAEVRADLTGPYGRLSELADMSIEQLINLKVTSPSKKIQRVSEASAAVFVITGEDIRRSGVTTVPEALRMAPGLQVARINNHRWAISSRGFNGLFANKLLVLIDGRSVYTPLFSGVFWDTQDVDLEDVDRIEVIRGPGATLWGSNAVNGVINIITKSALETKGSQVTVGGGTSERVFSSVRTGSAVGDSDAFRVYAKQFDRDNFVKESGDSAHDGWRGVQSGARYDWQPSEQDTVTLQSDGYYQEEGIDFILPSLTPPFRVADDHNLFHDGANVLGRWTHRGDSGSESQLQLYYDRVDRNDFIIEHSRNTFDVDFQNRFTPFDNDEILWGLGARYYNDRIDGSFTLSADPRERDVDQYTAFLQNELAVLNHRLHLMAGAKFEYTEFTYLEVQPNVRALYELSSTQTLWAAISRAARTPSRISNDGRINIAVQPGPGGVPVVASTFGNEAYESENLMAYETGYRSNITEKLSTDIALFFNHYSDLQTLEPGAPFAEESPAPEHLVAPFFFDNRASADTYGGELLLDYTPARNWRMVGSYQYLLIDIDPKGNSRDVRAQDAEGASPQHQFMVRSLLDLPHNFEFDSALRFVDSLNGSNVPRYWELDLRLGWNPGKDLEFSVVAQNLLHDNHLEFVPADFVVLQPVDIERGVFGRMTYKF